MKNKQIVRWLKEYYPNFKRKRDRTDYLRIRNMIIKELEGEKLK